MPLFEDERAKGYCVRWVQTKAFPCWYIVTLSAPRASLGHVAFLPNIDLDQETVIADGQMYMRQLQCDECSEDLPVPIRVTSHPSLAAAKSLLAFLRSASPTRTPSNIVNAPHSRIISPR